MSIKSLFLALLVFVLANLSFVGIHLLAERSVSAEQVKTRVVEGLGGTQAFRQAEDCYLGLLSLHRGDNPVSEALAPGYVMREGRSACQQLSVAVNGAEDGVLHRAWGRWHGAASMTMLLSDSFSYEQMSRLFTAMAWVLMVIIVLAAFAQRASAGLALLPLLALGMLALPADQTGISTSLSLLVSMLLIFGFALLQKRPQGVGVVYTVLAGSVMAFFYGMGGALMLFTALMLFVLWFMDRPGGGYVRRLGRLIGLSVVFVTGFFGSFAVKQFMIQQLPELQSNWREVVAHIPLYPGLNMNAASWMGLWNPGLLLEMNNRYIGAALNNPDVVEAIRLVGVFAWPLAALLALIYMLLRGTGRTLMDFLVFALIGVIPLARYLLLPDLSLSQAEVVSRYLFVFFATGMGAVIWYLLQYRKRAGEVAAAPAVVPLAEQLGDEDFEPARSTDESSPDETDAAEAEKAEAIESETDQSEMDEEAESELNAAEFEAEQDLNEPESPAVEGSLAPEASLTKEEPMDVVSEVEEETAESDKKTVASADGDETESPAREANVGTKPEINEVPSFIETAKKRS